MTDQGAMPAYPEWIVRSDRLPPHDQKVLVFGCVFGFRNIWLERRRDGEWFDDNITHWMPLPEPPALSDQPTRQEE